MHSHEQPEYTFQSSLKQKFKIKTRYPLRHANGSDGYGMRSVTHHPNGLMMLSGGHVLGGGYLVSNTW